ncbi:hypothetical protein [Gracilibacillus sp. YIM 98692]|uniref:hypothetical protein n=1 Tax=Gracilibacillus sp. YIM 98692 TaxID=2663532 RepID=UPI0013D4C307|nr:hypothetical protein [Gracilibacillus sp. YIM 98692]
MKLSNLKNLQFFSQFTLKDVEDRLIITADFPKEYLKYHQLEDPFLYVVLYLRGSVFIKIIDEGSAQIYVPTRKEIEQETFNQIIQFAIKNAPQFKKYN